MRRLIRGSLSLALLAGLLALSTATALAGGYATAAISGGDEPPVAGEEREVRVTLLQHGVTPVNDGTVTITAWLPGSGERLQAAAASVGSGEWVAAMTFPTDGDWQIQVLHSDLQTPAAQSFSVAPSAAGTVLGGLGAIGAMLLAAVALIGVSAVIGSRRRPSAPAEAPVREPARVG